jgi:GR25 family glycosyltransferase involved in LPS biosynthesis
MIDWKKFDRIYCIHYLPYTDRFRKCMSELERVGIKGSGVFSWRLTWDSPIFDKLYEICDAAPSLGCMKVGFSHYQCIKEAYELGFKRILILENDNIFLKDLDKLEEIMNDLPDSDIVLLDKIPATYAGYDTAIKENKINEHFIDIGRKFYVLANCYALTRKGMEHVIKNQERSLNVSDKYLRYNTTAIEEPGLTRAAAIKTICIQNPDYEAESENAKMHKAHPGGVNSNIDDYKRIGVVFEDYNQ